MRMILFCICFIIFALPLTGSIFVTFEIYQENKTWEEAQAFCRNKGEWFDLARIDNAAENLMVKAQLSVCVPFYEGGLWIAGRRKENEESRKQWEWKTRIVSIPFSYSDWAVDQPDDYNYLLDSEGETGAEYRNFGYGPYWNDFIIEVAQYFICQFRFPCLWS